MLTVMDKAKAILVATELFKKNDCINVELGYICDRTDCHDCARAFVTLVQDIINGTEAISSDENERKQ